MELTVEQIKKLNSIERRMKKVAKDIDEMGFNVYLNNGTISIMNSSSHDERQESTQENVVWYIPVDRWDGGDW